MPELLAFPSHMGKCELISMISHESRVKAVYVILDNLLRRQLTPEKQAFLLDDPSRQYEIGRGGDRHSEDFKKDNMSSLKEDVNEKTAKKINVSAKTVQRARAYVKAVIMILLIGSVRTNLPGKN